MGSSISRKESHSAQQIRELKDWAGKLGFAIIAFSDLERRGLKLESFAAYKDWGNE